VYHPPHISNKLQEPVQFLVFLPRCDVAELKLASLAARVIEQHGGKVDLAVMTEFDVSSYDQDTYDADGFPPGAEEFHRRLEANDAFVIASPEYNASIPGLLKNAIDWVSRYHPQLRRRSSALSIAFDGRRKPGLWALAFLGTPGARVFPICSPGPGTPGFQIGRRDC
jgi:hypothetical protein